MSTVTEGNVFKHIGFNESEAAELALRTYLTAEIRKFVQTNGITRARAADFFGTTRSKIGDIMNGRIEETSVGFLVGLLAKTGGEFRYEFEQPSKKEAVARLSG